MAGKRHKKKGATVAAKSMQNGHEVWHVASGGRTRRITTRSASSKAISEAVVIYGEALQRLANR